MGTAIARLWDAWNVAIGKAPSPSSMIASLNTFHGEPPKRGTPEILEAYSTMPWLRAVTSKVAVAVAGTNWHLYAARGDNGKFYRLQSLQRDLNFKQRQKELRILKAKGELVEIVEHPMNLLLHNANKFHVGVAARRVLQAHMDLAGEFFQLLERNKFKAPVAYWPIPPHWVQELPTSTSPVYRVKVGHKEFPIPISEIIWGADPDPLNPYGRGSSISLALGDELETSEYASKHVKAAFYNRARPDFVAWVKPNPGEGSIGRNELRRLQQNWVQQYQGFWRAYKPHFTNREMQIHEFEQDFRKQSLVPIMEHERDTIIQVFGFPPEIFGILEASNRATIDAADYLFSRYAVAPRLEFLRDTWQEKLVPMYDDRLILEYENPVSQDKEHQRDITKSAPWAFRVDDIRDMANLDPLDDGEGQVFGVPVNIMIMDELKDMTSLLEDEPPTGELSTKGSIREGLVIKSVPPNRINALARRLEPEMRAAFLNALMLAKDSIDMVDLEARIALGDVEGIVASLPWAIFRSKLGTPTAVAMRRAIESVAQLAATDLGGQIGIEIGFDLSGAPVTRWLTQAQAEFLDRSINVSRDAIRNELIRAFEEGMNPRELAIRIRDHMGLTEAQMKNVRKFETKLREQGVSEEEIARRRERLVEAHRNSRAQTIARTETIRAAAQGQQLVWEDAVLQGYLQESKITRTWLVTPDDRLCIDVCEPMDGQEVGLKQEFETGTGEMIPNVPAHPLCRCAVSMEIEK